MRQVSFSESDYVNIPILLTPCCIWSLYTKFELDDGDSTYKEKTNMKHVYSR